MRLFNKENKNKETHRLPMGQKSKRALAVYSALVFLLCCCTTTAFAAGDPLTVINNLSDFIFGLIRAIGMILLGDNDYLAEYNGVKCHAMFNPFVGRYFVDDVYGIVRSSPERGER